MDPFSDQCAYVPSFITAASKALCRVHEQAGLYNQRTAEKKVMALAIGQGIDTQKVC